jgi:hypothetical protein
LHNLWQIEKGEGEKEVGNNSGKKKKHGCMEERIKELYEDIKYVLSACMH